MLHWALLPLRRITDYRGRSRRREFWLFTLAMVLAWAALYTLAEVLFPLAEGQVPDPSNAAGPQDPVTLSPDGHRFFNMLSRPLLLFFAAVHLPLSIRRLHDTGRTWWAYLVVFLPYVGVLILLWLFIKDSEPYGNKWGPDPKGRDQLPRFADDQLDTMPLPAARIREG
ncbi:DUF805 domain-containing protein [Qipengyuania gaetbuli]|uniref:DUF805 domain-containing protein n=1 Tax=Qipengyuania gaetbuli TaxID=266952 RepID=UPI001CD33B8C|nr:DUF805 domain-containing protein [Qipengyuania gaetbuli]MCA0910869.1 DUF805 domain-containing protein [Qipengyuania gaetbuli]